MFYRPGVESHQLPHDPFKAIVAPRPIGWISSLNEDGHPNLEPYSFFNAISSRPPIVMFSSEGEKDSVTNVEATGEFACNLATWDMRDAMNRTSATLKAHENEFDFANVGMVPCQTISAPRVEGAAAALECKVLKIDRLNDLDGHPAGIATVFGQVTGIYIDDSKLVDGHFDMTLAKTIARSGYRDYVVVDELFQMVRPKV